MKAFRRRSARQALECRMRRRQMLTQVKSEARRRLRRCLARITSSGRPEFALRGEARGVQPIRALLLVCLIQVNRRERSD